MDLGQVDLAMAVEQAVDHVQVARAATDGGGR
jgi:hypothetical protein